MMKIVSIMLAGFLSSSCVDSYKWSYIGAGVDSMHVAKQGSGRKDSYAIIVRKSQNEAFVEHLREVLDNLGIGYETSEREIVFVASYAELIGFIAAASSDGQVSVDILQRQIVVEKLGFPVESEDIKIIQSRD